MTQLSDTTTELGKLQAASSEFAAKDLAAREQLTALRKAGAAAERRAADQASEIEALTRRVKDAEDRLKEARGRGVWRVRGAGLHSRPGCFLKG
jgi:hypothetical protein